MKAPPAGLAALIERAAARPRMLLLLDYDGTLVPIRARPDLTRLGGERRATLKRLQRGRARVAVISGRSLRGLREQVPIPGIAYGGVFGLELAAPGWGWRHPSAKARRPALAALKRSLRGLYADLPGVLIEDKRAGLAVHFRGVPARRLAEFARRLRKARRAAPRGLLWLRTAFSWEIVPRTGWNKGKAALLLRKRLGRPFLIAIGNDRFDEPMLRTAERYGAGIRVGEGASVAGCRLKNPAAVHRFLSALAQKLAPPSCAARPPESGSP